MSNSVIQTRGARLFSANAGWVTLGVVILALLPRLYVAVAWSKEPVWDGHYYHFGATRLASGLGYSEDIVVGGISRWNPWCHYPVGYSALLAAFYLVFGTSILVGPLVNALIGTLTVLVVHRIARHYLSETRALVAAVLAAVHPGLIAYTALVMTEPAAGLFALAAGWCALQTKSRPGWAVIGTGVLLGLGALIRPPTLLAVPLLLLVFPRPWFGALKKTVLVGAISLLVLSPWTLRNCRVMDGCALVSTNGGWNLAIGALTKTGRFTTLTAKDGCPVVTGQVQQDRCWAEVGRRAISSHPLEWLSVVPLKLRHTYNHESFAIEYLREADPGSWPEEKRAQGRSLLTVFHHLLMFASFLAALAAHDPRKFRLAAPDARRAMLVQWALLASAVGFATLASEMVEPPLFWFGVTAPLLAALNLPGAPRQGGAGRFLFGLVFATTFTHAMFFGDDRYHVVVSPVLCVLAAAALRSVASRGSAVVAAGSRDTRGHAGA